MYLVICVFIKSPPLKGLISCVFFLAYCVAGQTDGESEEEQESAGTGEEDEDGDESDLVTPAPHSDFVFGGRVKQEAL